MKDKKMFNVRVEYDPVPIRHIAVQCPGCGKWFLGGEISDDELRFKHEIMFAAFECPVCGTNFGGLNDKEREPKIQTSAYPDVYEGCLRRKEIWE